MNDFWKQPEIPQECEDRHYWHKRFNFATWLFLLFSFWAMFTGNFMSALLALSTSMGFNVFDSWHSIRHIKWHLENDKEIPRDENFTKD